MGEVKVANNETLNIKSIGDVHQKIENRAIIQISKISLSDVQYTHPLAKLCSEIIRCYTRKRDAKSLMKTEK